MLGSSILGQGRYREWLLQGLLTTLELSACAALLALALGLALFLLRAAPNRLPRLAATAVVEFIRNTPLLVQIFFWYFGASEFLPEAVSRWLSDHGFEFIAATLALSVYTAAFVAEDLRSGLRAIPREQMEAARACGLSFLQSMRRVVLPQAAAHALPALVSQALNLTKNSSMAMTIGVAELTYQTRQIESYSFRSFEAFGAATLLYLAISLAIGALGNRLERRSWARPSHA